MAHVVEDGVGAYLEIFCPAADEGPDTVVLPTSVLVAASRFLVRREVVMMKKSSMPEAASKWVRSRRSCDAVQLSRIFSARPSTVGSAGFLPIFHLRRRPALIFFCTQYQGRGNVGYGPAVFCLVQHFAGKLVVRQGQVYVGEFRYQG